MEIHDGDGLRTTVFFKGCPLKCIWCHNPESISFERQFAFFKEKCCGCGGCEKFSKEETQLIVQCCPTEAKTFFGEEYDVRQLADLLAVDKPFFENGGGVTLSGGECLAQSDFAVALAKELKENGIGVYIDTCGFVKREVFDRIIPYADKFLYDIKAIDSDAHKTYTGQDNDIILSNLEYLLNRGCDVEIRYPLVMGYNSSECEKIGSFLSDKGFKGKIKVLRYHNFSVSRYEALGMECALPDTITQDSDVDNAVNILKSYNLNAIK